MSMILRFSLLYLLFLWQISAYAAVFDYIAFQELINATQPKSVDELFVRLPVNLRTNFVLFTHTQSQDQASPESPRIVLFNEDATLLLAVSGDQRNPRGHFMEVIRFDKETSRFIPSEIEFGNQISDTTNFKIQENPSSCYGCHGNKSFHPNWNSYDVWPGAFGSSHTARIPQRPKAHWAYWKFLLNQRKANNSRFTLLNKMPLNVGTLASRNSELTRMLAVLNTDRIAQIIIDELKRKPVYLPSVLAALTKKRNAFVRILNQTHSVNEQQLMEKLKSYDKRFVNLTQKECEAKLKMGLKVDGYVGSTPFRGSCFDQELVPYFSMFQVLEDLGFSLMFKTWSTVFKNSALEFATPYGYIFTDVALSIFERDQQRDQVLSSFYELKEFSLARKLELNKKTLRPYSEIIGSYLGLTNTQVTKTCGEFLD